MIEVIVVVAILAVAVVAVTPRLSRSVARQRDEALLHRVATDLNWVRQSAIGAGRSMKIVFAADGYSYRCDDLNLSHAWTSPCLDVRLSGGDDVIFDYEGQPTRGGFPLGDGTIATGTTHEIHFAGGTGVATVVPVAAVGGGGTSPLSGLGGSGSAANDAWFN